ncbi:ABC transporter permease [Myxococcota bacterium]|nr:ABC transporter permease [Myxococcota bacterium]
MNANSAGAFESTIAFRYLRADRSHWFVVLMSVALLALGAALFYCAGSFGSRPDFLKILPHGTCYYGGLISVALGVGVLLFALILAVFNVYSTISIFGVFLGTATMVVVLSVLGGLEGEQTRQIVSFSPHVVITRPNDERITQATPVAEKINSALKGLRVEAVIAPYIEEEVLLKAVAYEASQGVLLRGLDPNHPTFDLERHMKQGTLRNLVSEAAVKWLDAQVVYGTYTITGDGYSFVPPWPSDLPGIIISTEQARTLGLSLGHTVDVISPRGTMTPTGPVPKLIRFRVAGLYGTKYFKYDLRYAFTTLEHARKFSARNDQLTGWELRLQHLDEIDRTADGLSDVLGKDFVVGTWKTQNRALFSAMKLEKVVMFIILVVIILVAAFSITANLIMVVIDKQSEISILKALGATNRSIRSIFMLQGVFIGVLGLVLGMLAGLGVCAYMANVGIRMSENIFMFARIPVSVSVFDVVSISLSSLMLSLLATLYPAHKAAVISPIEGLTAED